MVHIRCTRLFEKDAATMWAAVSKFQDAHEVHPHVDNVTLLTPNKARGVGARRRTIYQDGCNSTETVTEWDEIHRTYTVDMVDGQLPIKKGHRLRKVTTKYTVEEFEGGTRLTVHMEVCMKLRGIGKLGEHCILRPQCRMLLEMLVEGIGHYVEFRRKLNFGSDIDDFPGSLNSAD